MDTGTETAADRWRRELAAWEIDEDILAGAEESPYALPPALFRPGPAAEGFEPQPSRDVALAALPAGGSVLDVGCGAGAAGLALAPPAALLVGVDEKADMLEAFQEAAAERGVEVVAIQGSWPEAAGHVPVADVVVCHHVAYNVADLVPFARALDEHARRRVVLELTDAHPWVGIGPLWMRAHGQPRPAGPTAELAAEVLHEAGYPVQTARSQRPGRAASFEERVIHTRRRLCLPIAREAEVAEWMRDLGLAEGPPPREVVTLWWDVTRG